MTGGRAAAVRAARALSIVLGWALAACAGDPEQTSRDGVSVSAIRRDDEIQAGSGEDLAIERISPVAGFAYSAELLAPVVPGLREGGTGRALRLVENGVALGPAGSLSADVVGLGGGRFNHETRSRTLFSTSDNSDPRTNGRRYRAEWDEPARVRTRAATRVLGRGTADTVVETPVSRPVHFRRLMVENLDSHASVRVWGRRQGAPDLSSRDSIVASAIQPGMTDEEKSLALWRLVTLWRRPDVAAANGPEVGEPVKLLGIYGFGFCNDTAHALANLLQRAGLRARVVAWAQHTVVEVRFGGRWHLLDADRGRTYRLASGDLASVADVFARRVSQVVAPWGVLPTASEALARIYPRGADRQYHRPFRAPAHDLRPVLEPRDVLVVDVARPKRVVDRFSVEPPLGWPMVAAGGTLVRAARHIDDDGCRMARVSWPYPIVSLALTAGDLPTSAKLAAQVRGNENEPWEETRLERVADEARANADAWISRGPLRYALEARICQGQSDGSASGAAPEMRLEVGFQLAPSTIPRVEAGRTSLVWSVESVAEATAADSEFAGVRITHEWDELDASFDPAPPPGSLVFELDPRFLVRTEPVATTFLVDQFGWRVPSLAAILPNHSRLTVYENGRELGPSGATLAEIRERGRGRYAHANVWLSYSATDGTSPKDNRRIYSVALTPRPTPATSR